MKLQLVTAVGAISGTLVSLAAQGISKYMIVYVAIHLDMRKVEKM